MNRLLCVIAAVVMTLFLNFTPAYGDTSSWATWGPTNPLTLEGDINVTDKKSCGYPDNKTWTINGNGFTISDTGFSGYWIASSNFSNKVTLILNNVTMYNTNKVHVIGDFHEIVLTGNSTFSFKSVPNDNENVQTTLYAASNGNIWFQGTQTGSFDKYSRVYATQDLVIEGGGTYTLTNATVDGTLYIDNSNLIIDVANSDNVRYVKTKYLKVGTRVPVTTGVTLTVIPKGSGITNVSSALKSSNVERILAVADQQAGFGNTALVKFNTAIPNDLESTDANWNKGLIGKIRYNSSQVQLYGYQMVAADVVNRTNAVVYGSELVKAYDTELNLSTQSIVVNNDIDAGGTINLINDSNTSTLSLESSVSTGSTITGNGSDPIIQNVADTTTNLNFNNVKFIGQAIKADIVNISGQNITFQPNESSVQVIDANNINLQSGSQITVDGAFNLADSNLTIDSTGTATITGSMNQTGGNTIVNGTLTLNSDSTLNNFSGTGNLTIDSGTTTISGIMNQTGGNTTVNGALTLNSNSTLNNLSGTGAVTQDAGLTINVDTESTTFQGTISGDGNVTKTGTGVLELTGANNYGGTTTISVGTIKLTDSGTLGTSSVQLNGGTLEIANSPTISSIAGTGNLTIDSGTTTISGTMNQTSGNTTVNGALILKSDSTLSNFSGTGNLTIDSGTTTISGTMNQTGGNTTVNGALTLNSNSTLNNLSGTGTVTQDSGLTINVDTESTEFKGTISGNGNVSKTGTGVLELSGTNDYAGTTTISKGTIKLNGDGTLGTSTVELNGGTLEIANSPTVSSVSGTGNLTIDSGTTTISGVMSQTGGNTTVNGALTLNSNSTLNNLSGTGTVTQDSGLTINVDTASTEFQGTISGNGNVSKTGAGVLELTGANNYEGTTTISVGTIKLTDNGTLGTSTVELNSGTLEIANSPTVSSISGTGNLTIDSGTTTISGVMSQTGGNTTVNGALTLNSNSTLNNLSGTGTVTQDSGLTINVDTASTEFQGTISGNGNVFKTGSGVLVLSGANNYAGTTTISKGTIKLTGNGTLGAGAVVFDGGTLETTGSVTVESLPSNSNLKIDTGSTITVTDAVNQTSGETNLNGGTLNLQQGGTINNLSGTGTLTTGGNLTIDVDKNTEKKFTGKISASGQVITNNSEGTLKIDATAKGNDIIVTRFIQKAGELDIKGQLYGDLELEGGTFSPGNSIGDIYINGATNITGTALMSFEINKDENGKITRDTLTTTSFNDNGNSKFLDLVVTGSPLEENEQFVIIKANNINGDISTWLTDSSAANWTLFNYNNKVYAIYGSDPHFIPPVPEPSTWVLLILGIAGLIWYRRKK